MTRASWPPALLLDATWWGTLAAARDLGSRGVPVTLASDVLIAPARWSRCVTHTVRCPPKREPRRVLEWLLEFGRRSPGHVLYPTSDEIAWLVSANRKELSGHFHLYSPPLPGLARLLDKHGLGEAARGAALGAPRSWCPANEEEVAALAPGLAYPVYVKPRTQVFALGARGKGARVEHPAELLPTWRSWRDRARYAPEVSGFIPGVELPIVQASGADTERIYTLDGFIDASGELHATRACVKVLQWPRGSGPGVCFEQAPVLAEIESDLLRLFRRVGFHGVFDAEFIEHDGRHLLIDVNPRFYNHMAFERDRGLPLAWLAYLAALQDFAALREAVADARRAVDGTDVYVHRLPLHLLLRVQALAGRMTREEAVRWRGWLARDGRRTSDPVRQAGDAAPALAEVAMELVRLLEHPRGYVRALAHPGPRRVVAP